MACLDYSHHDEDGEGERRVADPSEAIASGVLLGHAEYVGKDAATEGANLADHAAGDRSGNRPAKRHQLEGCAIACAQCREAEHEE